MIVEIRSETQYGEVDSSEQTVYPLRFGEQPEATPLRKYAHSMPEALYYISTLAAYAGATVTEDKGIVTYTSDWKMHEPAIMAFQIGSDDPGTHSRGIMTIVPLPTV